MVCPECAAPRPRPAPRPPAPVDPAAQQRERDRQEQIRQQKLQTEAYKANKRGREEFDKGHYDKALLAFREADRAWPMDIYRNNMILAANRLGARLYKDADRKLATVNSAVSTQLTQSQQKANAILANSQTTGPPENRSIFGTPGNPDKPALADGTVGEGPQAPGTALGQASSVSKSGGAAVAAGANPGNPNNLNTIDPDVMKATSNCGFGAAACAQPGLTGVARPQSQWSQASTELYNRLPESARNNPAVLQHMAEYNQAAVRRQDDEQKIAGLEQKIKAGSPDAEALKAYQASLVNQVAKDKEQEKAATDAIENLGVVWVEEAPRPAPSAAPHADKEKQEKP